LQSAAGWQIRPVSLSVFSPIAARRPDSTLSAKRKNHLVLVAPLAAVIV
jgi:hypothetical protein